MRHSRRLCQGSNRRGIVAFDGDLELFLGDARHRRSSLDLALGKTCGFPSPCLGNMVGAVLVFCLGGHPLGMSDTPVATRRSDARHDPGSDQPGAAWHALASSGQSEPGKRGRRRIMPKWVPSTPTDRQSLANDASAGHTIDYKPSRAQFFPRHIFC